MTKQQDGLMDRGSNMRGGQKVLNLGILYQNFCYCLYISKTHLSYVPMWAC